MESDLYVLRKLLDDPAKRTEVMGVLTYAHFSTNATKFLFRCVKEITVEGPISIDVVRSHLDHLGLDKKALEHLYPLLGSITALPPQSNSEFAFHLKIMVDAARSKTLYAGVTKALKKADEGEFVAAEEALRRVSDESANLVPGQSRKVSAREVLNLVPDEEKARFGTGFEKVDELTGGGRPGELWLWAAYTGEYKSTALISMAYENVMAGRGVFFVSMEMDSVELRRRILCMHANRKFSKVLEYSKISSALAATSSSTEVLKTVAEDFQEGEYGDFQIWEPPLNTTIDDVMREHRNLEGDFPVMLIDYMQKLSPVNKKNQFRLELTETVDRAKRHAMEGRDRQGIWVISAWQTSRDGRKKAEEQGYYDLWALSESVGAEQSSNVVVWSLATSTMVRASEVKVGLAKSRNSSIADSMHYLQANPEIGLFSREPVREAYPDEPESIEEAISDEDLNSLLEIAE